MASCTQIIPIGQLSPSPTNPRKVFNEAKILELAETMTTTGQLQAIVVRLIPLERVNTPAYKAGSCYEIIAGERRYRAALVAGLPSLECSVRFLTDMQVLEVQVIENSQREDVHPLEECAGFEAILAQPEYKEADKPVKLLAEKLGKSEKFVYDRLKLRSLIPECAEAFLAGDITAGHAIIIARLTPEAQSEALTFTCWLSAWRNGSSVARAERLDNPQSVRELANWIKRTKAVPFDRAQFDLDSLTLLPGVGACSACPKRSEDGAMCLDLACFGAKKEAHVAEMLAAVKEANLVPVIVTNSYEGKGGKLGWGEYSECDEETPGALPSIHEQTGEFRWVQPKKAALADPKAREEAEKKEKEARKATLLDIKAETKARAETAEWVEGALPDDLVFDAFTVRILRALAAKTALASNTVSMSTLCEGFGATSGLYQQARRDDILNIIACLSDKDLLKFLFNASILDELNYSEYHQPAPIALEAFCEATNIDVAHIRREVKDALLAGKKSSREKVQTSAQGGS